MAAESSQRATSSSKSGWRYDVFLSFQGETRLGFTDHLHSALQSKGLIVFRDEEKLERGKNIRPSLSKAIQESEYKVIVISKDYASSTWCLDELIEILKCKAEKVLPVFYDVDPSHVRKQMDSFAAAFAEHTRKKVDEKQMTSWRDALREVCDHAGWDVRGRHEAEVVKEICSDIFSKLSRSLLDMDDDLVGIESQMKELMNLLHVREEDEDVRFLGIWGMGGVGKTTLAEVIYNRISHQFDARCFISNVREKSGDLISLQQQLISHILGVEESLIREKICNISQGQTMIARRLKNKKVFIVLDNVDKEDQLEALARKPGWFGKGSRILVTSRDSQLLKRYINENWIYEVKGLYDHDALQLFLSKAFNKPCHERSYVKLAKEIVKYAGGLPLALKVFGSFLFDSTIEAWKCALDRLKADPDSTILDRLQISFEGLENLQKKLFLDIACFYKGEYVDNITYKLEALGRCPKIDLPILEKKSLIKISKTNGIEMHNLLQEMGRQLVYLESPNEPGERSRLWNYEDIIHVLNNNTGTNVVEAIILKLPLPKPMKLNFEGFLKMKKLKILVIHLINYYYRGNNKILEDLKSVKWCGNLSKFMISNELRILEWWGYPLECMPTNFELDNLVELKMPMSNIKKLWDETKNFEKLKYINLRDSRKLAKMSNLRGIPNIEELDINGTRVTQLRSSSVLSEKLRVLSVGGGFSSPVTFLPRDLPLSLRFLRELNLSYCNISDVAFLNEMSCSHSLKKLDLSGNNFTRMASISRLSKLRRLLLNNCTRLKSLPPKLQGSIWRIELSNCPSLTPFSDPKDLLTSSKMLVAGGIAVNAHYFGSNGKRDVAKHVAQPCLNDSFGTIDAAISWGPTLTSDVPEWFNQKSTSLPNISGTFRFDFDVNVQLLYDDSFWFMDTDTDSDSDMAWDLDLLATNFYDEKLVLNGWKFIYACWGYALFIVYEVLEVNSCERNGSSTTFPVFVCELGVNNEDDQKVPKKCRGTSPKVPLAFRVPELSSVGRNGIWVFLNYGCFADVVLEMGWSYIGSCSITVSSPSPNVEVKECGGRLVLKHDYSEFHGITRGISTRGSKCFDNLRGTSPKCTRKLRTFPYLFTYGGPVRREFLPWKRKSSEVREKWTTEVLRKEYWTRESLEKQVWKEEGVEICEDGEEEESVAICCVSYLWKCFSFLFGLTRKSEVSAKSHWFISPSNQISQRCAFRAEADEEEVEGEEEERKDYASEEEEGEEEEREDYASREEEEAEFIAE